MILAFRTFMQPKPWLLSGLPKIFGTLSVLQTMPIDHRSTSAVEYVPEFGKFENIPYLHEGTMQRCSGWS